MVLETGAIEGYLSDACFLGALGNQRTHLGGGVGVAGRTLTQGLVQRGSAGQHLATIRRDDLRVDVTGGTVDAQAIHAQLADLGASAAGTTETRFFLRVHNPALLLLGFFATHLLVGVPDTLALVGLGRTEGADFRCSVRSEERRVGKECRSRWSPYH